MPKPPGNGPYPPARGHRTRSAFGSTLGRRRPSLREIRILYNRNGDVCQWKCDTPHPEVRAAKLPASTRDRAARVTRQGRRALPERAGRGYLSISLSGKPGREPIKLPGGRLARVRYAPIATRLRSATKCREGSFTSFRACARHFRSYPMSRHSVASQYRSLRAKRRHLPSLTPHYAKSTISVR